jgi:hypothetical protein
VKITASNLIRWAGASAMLAGILFVVVGLLHPPETLSSVTTGTWALVHGLAIAMACFGLLGITGLYARQAEAAGWLGLAGYLLLSLWYVLVTGYTFAEVFLVPRLATEAPAFAEGFLGIFTGAAGVPSFGALATLWTVVGVLYLLGGLLFGVATLRAGILSRWPAGLLAVGTVSTLVFGRLPHEFARFAAVPMGLGLAWLGYALWSERRGRASEPVPARGRPRLRPTGAA